MAPGGASDAPRFNISPSAKEANLLCLQSVSQSARTGQNSLVPNMFPSPDTTRSRMSILTTAAAVRVREALGAGIGILAAACVAFAVSRDLWLTVYLIAPFGATAVLVFAVPSSPLAQPWPAIAGNAISASVAILVCKLMPTPWFAAPAAVSLSIVAMALAKATHPPGGAVAMTVVLNYRNLEALGFSFALFPVASGTAVLVVWALLWARATGRHYPLRSFGGDSAHGTADAAAVERLGLSEGELADILASYRRTLNLGVEDLARLIGAAELRAAGNRAGATRIGEIMSKDLVTVSPGTPLSEVARLFIRHRFTSIPVVGNDGEFLGIIFHSHLLQALYPDRHPRTWLDIRKWNPAKRRGDEPVAADVMAVSTPVVAPDSGVSVAIPQLATTGVDALPVILKERIVGIVTQTDLIAALSRRLLDDAAGRLTPPAGAP